MPLFAFSFRSSLIVICATLALCEIKININPGVYQYYTAQQGRTEFVCLNGFFMAHQRNMAIAACACILL